MRTDTVARRALVAAVLLTASAAALACGDRIATRGGQMNDDPGEMNFELVSRGRSFVVHLEDHGAPIATRGASAVLEVKREGGSSWSTPLRAAGDNRFTTSLPAGLLRGDSVAVKVAFANGSIAHGHFRFGIEPAPRRPSFVPVSGRAVPTR